MGKNKHRVTKRTSLYIANKESKVGETITCPVCGKTFTKRQWQQAFCCGECKNKYWNDKGDRHKNPLYYSEYNQKHPERYEYLLNAGRTDAERRHNEALYELATNKEFREYVNDGMADGSWDEHNCNVELEDQLSTFYNK